MDRDLISRTLQNIINISHVWEFDKFSHDNLSEALRNEMLDACKDKDPQAKEEIDKILSKHHDAIMNIENNTIEAESHALFLEALRKWKRDYFL